ncbi:hypothetical protein MAR_001557 [Mya arenaria]|uniref:Uncharacterized protein n=1 Tax=Mya arenaria TaxID=6604 RepID=A0ABY7FEZ6_MYAAR|nr:hypothetical protein MAR_001557 [Mya arenaria]
MEKGRTFLMTAFSVYCDNILDADRWKGGSGFYLTIVAWLLAWTSSALAGYQKYEGGSAKGGNKSAAGGGGEPAASNQPTGVSNITYSNPE